MSLSNLNTLSEGAYFSLLYNMIKQRENPWLLAGTGYDKIHNGGGDGNPTFGYGFNLAAFNAQVVQNVILHAYNNQLTSQQSAGLDLILDWKTGASVNLGGSFGTLSNADIINLANFSLNNTPAAVGSTAQRAAVQSLTLNDAQATKMLDVMIKGHLSLVHIEGPSGSWGYEDGLDYRLQEEGSPAYSTERASLLSVYYNAPSLIGPGVQNAINTDDRAQLWYEIRYNHNHTNHNGLQSRRAEEADLLGLVSQSAKDNPNANITEYAFELNTIFNEDDRLDRRILTRIEERDGLDDLQTAIAPELQALLDYYVLQPLGASSAPTIDFVQADPLDQSATIIANDLLASGVPGGKSAADSVNLILGFGGDDYIQGLGADDYLYGGNGDDTIYGDGGATSFANAGHDLIDGGAGADRLYGGPGDDAIFGGNDDDNIRGEEGHDVLRGNSGDDTVTGQDGNDVLDGGEGNDLLRAGEGQDLAVGGAGDDRIFGQGGNDTLQGDVGADTLKGNAGDDLISGGKENDRILSGYDNDTVNAGSGDDFVAGQLGADVIMGSSGHDTLKGNGDGDFLKGGNDNDLIFGGDGNDTLEGGSGNDTLLGNLDNDDLAGASGADSLHGGAGDDTLNGGTGNDILRGAGGDDVFNFAPGDGNDTITDFNAINGTADTIFLSSAYDGIFDDFADIQAAATDVGSDVVIDFGNGDSLTIANTQIADLAMADFAFG